MNGPLFDDLLDQLRGNPAQQLGGNLGLSTDRTLGAVDAALPLLLGAMHRNTRDDAGAHALYSALETDHRGLDPGNVLGSVLAGSTHGAGILGHLFGTRRPLAEQALGSVAGIGQDRAGALLQAVAPMVMAYLARRLFTPRSADGASTPEASPAGLRNALDTEMLHMQSRGGPGAGLASMFDAGASEGGDVTSLMEPDAASTIPLGVQSAEMRSPRPLL